MIKKVTFLLAPVSFLLLVSLAFLFSTESGLVVIQKSVNRYGGGVVSIAEVEGSLLHGLRLKDIHLPGTIADIEVRQVDLSWRPVLLGTGKLAIEKLQVSGVRITVKDISVDDTVIVLPAVVLPFSVFVDSFVVNGIDVVDGQGQEFFLVHDLTASLSANTERIAVQAFKMEGPDIGLELHGNIEVQKNWQLDLLGNWHLAGFGFYPMAGTFSTSGSLAAPHVEIGIHSPGSIRVKGDFVDLLGIPKWTATVTANDVDLSTLIEHCPKVELAQVTGDLTGDFNSYRGHVTADGRWDALTDMNLVSEIDGDVWGIDFQSLRIYNQDRSVEAMGGKISWRDIFSWEGRFLFKNFDPSIITEVLQGQFDAELVSKGDVKEHGVVASFAIAHLDGLLRGHKVSATGNVQLNEYDVQTDGLIIRSGEVSGLAHVKKGSFSWTEQPSWSARVQLDHFDPSWLYAEFPGSIDGEFGTEGKLGKDGPEGLLKITTLSGTLRGNILAGNGEVSFSRDTLTTSGLEMKIGPSQLRVNGQAGNRLAVDFSFSSPDIGTFLPEAAGRVSLRGSLQGQREAPRVEAELQGNGLSYQDNRFGVAQAKIKADFSGKGQLAGSLAGEKMVLAGLPIDKGAIVLQGNLANHSITIDGVGPIGRLTGKAHGSYNGKWQGELSSFLLATDDLGIWRQLGETAFSVGNQGFSLEKFCLSNHESSACLQGDVQRTKDLAWQVHGELASLPLQWLNRLQLTAAPVSGLLYADVTANGNYHRILSAKVDSRVKAADVLQKVNDAERVPFYFAGSVFSLVLTDSIAQAHGDIRLRNGSQVVLNVDVAGAGDLTTPLASLPVQGQVDLRQFNLDSLAAFTDYGVEPSGRVNNSLTIAGTVGQPEIYGSIVIQDGGIDLPYQGITLENVVLSIEAGEKFLEINGTATSGPGKVTAAGTLQYGSKGIEGTVNIQGNDFLLVNLPEYTFRVDPDVRIIFAPDKYEVYGTIDVPYGLVTPEQMTGSVSASEDVVLVNGLEEEKVAGWPLYLKIKVRLGDDVHIDGYGLAGRLGGQLIINTTADNILAGRGELDLIDGSFTIYGRTLSIERGRMLFTGGPIDNPGVDVRAQVKVDDEKASGAGYIVGVDISGLVQDLEYRLFSDPFMEDTEILSLMIVGHSLAGSTQSEGSILEAAAVTLGVQGSGGLVKEIGNLFFLDDLHLEGSSTRENISLVVGKHLTKDLYIGYDLNMFSQIGQFRVRYDLTRGFSVETRSSSESTGTDLLYSFER